MITVRPSALGGSDVCAEVRVAASFDATPACVRSASPGSGVAIRRSPYCAVGLGVCAFSSPDFVVLASTVCTVSGSVPTEALPPAVPVGGDPLAPRGAGPAGPRFTPSGNTRGGGAGGCGNTPAMTNTAMASAAVTSEPAMGEEIGPGSSSAARAPLSGAVAASGADCPVASVRTSANRPAPASVRAPGSTGAAAQGVNVGEPASATPTAVSSTTPFPKCCTGSIVGSTTTLPQGCWPQ
jgi:hypothetical protein